MLSKQIKQQIIFFKEKIKVLEKELSIVGHLRKNDIILVEGGVDYFVARDGVRRAFFSEAPALLKIKGVAYSPDKGSEVIICDVLASEDIRPFSSPYQTEFLVTASLISSKIEILSLKELPLFVAYAYKSDLYMKLLKGDKK